MQVKEASPVLMTNTEVLEMLYKRSDRRKQSHKEISPSAMGPSLEHLEWIEEHTMEYLREQDCDCQSRESVARTLEALKRHDTLKDLTDGEKLQVVNHAAHSELDAHLIIEKCAERFSEQDINDLIQIVAQNLWEQKPIRSTYKYPEGS
eukprot:gb/GECG01006484.1/.p1 GENE.gb/GECG01006484.1/~~gb/GECG01006484.1/.p1  ORF type:complete len:149 (+),score=16.95 gb/GECG01006484.1/:1-447(+)